MGKLLELNPFGQALPFINEAKQHRDFLDNPMPDEVAELVGALNALGLPARGYFITPYQQYREDFLSHRTELEAKGIGWIAFRDEIAEQTRARDREVQRELARDLGIVVHWNETSSIKSLWTGGRCPWVLVCDPDDPEECFVGQLRDHDDMGRDLCRKFNVPCPEDDPGRQDQQSSAEVVEVFERMKELPDEKKSATLKETIGILSRGPYAQLSMMLGPKRFQEEVDIWLEAKYGPRDQWISQPTEAYRQWKAKNHLLRERLEELLVAFHQERGNPSSLLVEWSDEEGESVMIRNEGDDNDEESIMKDLDAEEEDALDQRMTGYLKGMREFAHFLIKRL